MSEMMKTSGYDDLMKRLLDWQEEELSKAENARNREDYEAFRKHLHGAHVIAKTMKLLDEIEKSRRV